MNYQYSRIPLLIMLLMTVLFWRAVPTVAGVVVTPANLENTTDFARDIEPIFHTKCYQCHGPDNQMVGLRFDKKEDALKGGYSGPVIVPGNAAQSKLIERVSSDKEGFKMPPAGNSLTASEIAVLRAWIDQGTIGRRTSPPERLRESLHRQKENRTGPFSRSTARRNPR